jgi:hypothetical protein
MNRSIAILRTALGVATLLLLAGCLAPPKHHPWEVSREDAKQIGSMDGWARLSTNDYVRVPESQMAAAVAMLKDVSFVQLDSAQAGIFAPALPAAAKPDLRPYLVRGASFVVPPLYTTLRYDAATDRLAVLQTVYNGEMLMPFRWVAVPDALVVLLSHPPEHVYPLAILGGDGVGAGLLHNGDMR